MAPSFTIRPAAPDDWPRLWPVVGPVIRAADTYAYDPAATEPEARAIWMAPDKRVYLAGTDAGAALGTYYLRPNQGGPGSHVCNAGYMVAEAARGQGLGEAMCRHSLNEARSQGYRAMQYNLVAATNAGAVRLWHRMGFATVGTLPGAFRHPTEGFVDALVMFQTL
ncbi:MAG: GNAT family N-acetyltransferase [Geminicoccaceae bacterium]|nr:GNAT family N-acetyltransferase [Geminicoccaceae bacterium]